MPGRDWAQSLLWAMQGMSFLPSASLPSANPMIPLFLTLPQVLRLQFLRQEDKFNVRGIIGTTFLPSSLPSESPLLISPRIHLQQQCALPRPRPQCSSTPQLHRRQLPRFPSLFRLSPRPPEATLQRRRQQPQTTLPAPLQALPPTQPQRQQRRPRHRHHPRYNPGLCSPWRCRHRGIPPVWHGPVHHCM